MQYAFCFVPVVENVDSSVPAAAFGKLLRRRGRSVRTYQPVMSSAAPAAPEGSAAEARAGNRSARPRSFDEIAQSVVRDGWNGWLSGVVGDLNSVANDVDVLLVAAPAPSAAQPFAASFTRGLIRALDGEIVLVADGARSLQRAWCEQLALAARFYSDGNRSRLVGCIVGGLRPHAEPIDSAIARVTKEYQTVRPRLPELVALVPEHATALPGCTPEASASTTEFVSRYLDGQWIDQRWVRGWDRRISTAAFYAELTRRARAGNRRIILPESTEPRVIRAAVACAQRGIAQCVLLGEPAAIKRVAMEQGVELPPAVEIVDAAAIRADHVRTLIELREAALSSEQAAQELRDDGLLATVLLAQGRVDGLVSGALHSSAATVRAALQIVKPLPGVKRASSIFFMCLPEQVLVYGDCAVNPDPDAETLAEIAIQSADTAVRFGLPARVAMLSYATEKSGSGPDVDKVRTAVELAKKRRPDLAIDGPLQYDAAAVPDVARRKAPDSPVAGQATVYIFPDLDTGNITYKAVQHSAGIVCIGPMLQGMRRPVSDLSRGASVEDIVYTIAATAVQAQA